MLKWNRCPSAVAGDGRSVLYKSRSGQLRPRPGSGGQVWKSPQARSLARTQRLRSGGRQTVTAGFTGICFILYFEKGSPLQIWRGVRGEVYGAQPQISGVASRWLTNVRLCIRPSSRLHPCTPHEGKGVRNPAQRGRNQQPKTKNRCCSTQVNHISQGIVPRPPAAPDGLRR
jgi:hypothetical protein